MNSIIFLPLLSLLLLIGGAAASSFPVYALGGAEVQQGIEYLLWSGDGGGFVVDLAAAVGQSCPRYVVPNYEGFEKARSVMFVPENQNDNTIRMNTTVYIKFAGESPCNSDKSTLWNLFSRYVKTGGTLPSPSDNLPHYSRFSIEFADGFPQIIYEIRSCPCGTSAEPRRPTCRLGCVGRIGRTVVVDDTLFGLETDEPLRVMFIRSSEKNAFIRSIRSATPHAEV